MMNDEYKETMKFLRRIHRPIIYRQIHKDEKCCICNSKRKEVYIRKFFNYNIKLYYCDKCISRIENNENNFVKVIRDEIKKDR